MKMSQHTNPILCFLIITLMVHFTYTFVCTPDFCARVTCEAIKKCESNQVLKPGGVCNCCNVCITILGENNKCGPILPIIGGPPPTSECDKGLVCLEGICRKISDK